MSLLVACVWVLLMVGCDSETTGPSDLGGFENPYDWVGEMHNKGLDYTLDIVIEDPDHDWTPEEIGILAADYYRSESKDENLPAGTGDMDFPSLTGVSLGGKPRYITYLDSLYDAGVVSDHFRGYAELVLGLCEQGDREGLATIAEEIDRSAAADEEKAILLAAISVGRHSLSYWSQTPKGCLLGSSQMIHPIAAADMVGAAVGGLSSWWNNRGSGSIDWWGIGGAALIGGLGASTLGFIELG
jgi:hypothetical protein